MKPTLLLAALFSLATAMFAQRGPQGQPAPPALLDCGIRGDAEVICGTRSPEDLELTPDGKFLIVSPYVTFRGGGSGIGFQLFDPAKKTFTSIPISSEPLKDWGDTACPGDPGPALAPHGTSLSKRANGVMQLYVVNHGGRQSIEMFELRQSAGVSSLVWHGCVVGTQDYNDVATMPDGGFVATHPTGMGGGGGNMFNGQPTGFVSRWIPGKGESELPGTRSGYPNGLLTSPDGRIVYYNAYSAMEVHKYDIQQGKDVGVAKLGFLPDNTTWTGKGQILAAGIKGARGNCPPESNIPCTQEFVVSVVNPAAMTSQTIFDSKGRALITGVSVALQMADAVYVGSFQGDRLVKFNWKE